MEQFDERLRRVIYSEFAAGRTPSSHELAELLGRPSQAVLDGFERLASQHALVLQPNGEILMAEPFSAIPTPFLVRSDGNMWWGNCIWDALGIPVMLRISAEVVTSCQCCGLRLTVNVANGERLDGGAGVAHFVVPAARWWENIAFT